MSSFVGNDDQHNRNNQSSEQHTTQQYHHLVERTIKHSDGSYRKIFRKHLQPPNNANIASELVAVAGDVLLSPALIRVDTVDSSIANSAVPEAMENHQASTSTSETMTLENMHALESTTTLVNSIETERADDEEPVHGEISNSSDDPENTEIPTTALESKGESCDFSQTCLQACETDGGPGKTFESLHNEINEPQRVCVQCHDLYRNWKGKEALLSPCGHKVCLTCILDYLQETLEKTLPLTCPSCHPFCNRPIWEFNFAEDEIVKSISIEDYSDLLEKVRLTYFKAVDRYPERTSGLFSLLRKLLECYPKTLDLPPLLPSSLEKFRSTDVKIYYLAKKLMERKNDGNGNFNVESNS